MKSFLKNRWVLLLLRFVVGGVFVYAGILKLFNPQAFADSIATFQILPPITINLVAMALPPLEILAGGMVVLGLSVARAASVLAILTWAFMMALLQAGLRGLEVDCGCFGGGEPSVWTPWIALMRNGILLAGCWWLALGSQKCDKQGSVEAGEATGAQLVG